VKVAIVHEWLQTVAGAERVLEQLLLGYPEADLFATVDFLPEHERGFLGGRAVQTSFIQNLPFARTRFRAYLGLMPLAVEQYDLSGYDLVISSSHAVAKGVLTGPDTLHVSYVHSPMRYAWDLQHQYLRQTGLDRGLKGWYARWQLGKLRMWDARTANGVDVFVANSGYVARRIRKCYRRDSIVIPPPVDIEGFSPVEERGGQGRGDAYLLASRMVPYKRMDLVAAAFAAMPERRLVIAGDGPERARVEAAAAGAPNITFTGAVSDAEMIDLMQRARAFVFAAEEDFGIMMVEAQACGTPVIAFGQGGARDIVQEGATGLFFAEQTEAAIRDAVARFEALAPFDPAACRANALRFSRAAFRERIRAVVDEGMARRG
jgi:glycosyltransferase involved in cell wall biosynthesis